MCTILTFDKRAYDTNPAMFLGRLLVDSYINSDGFSALVLGVDETQQHFIRSMNYESFERQLEVILDSVDWTRAWVHCRAATTGFVGINGCHGFAAERFSVFHNGVITAPGANFFAVDSELIAENLAYDGLDFTLTWLKTESFANVFIVDTETGEYAVSRSITGKLYTDGKGNYSTNPIKGLVEMPVAENYERVYPGFVIPKVEEFFRKKVD